MSDDGFRSVFLSIFENLFIRQFGYPAFYQAVSIKSTFEPITTPLKWVLADAACKVSMIPFNIASGLWREMQMVPKHRILFKNFNFKKFQKILAGGEEKQIKVSRALDTRGA